MLIQRILGLIIVLVVIAITMAISGHAMTLFDPMSIVYVSLTTLGIAMIALRPGEWFQSLFTESEKHLNKTSAEFFGSIFILSGASGTFIGLILILANLDDPEALVPGLSVALLTLVYGFFAKFIVDAFAAELHEPAAQSSKSSISGGMWILGIIILIVVIAFTMLMGGSLMLFFDTPSLLIVVVGGLGAVFISTCPETLALGLRAGLGKLYNSKDDAVKAVRICCGVYNRFMTFGFIGALIGLSYMFLNLNDPDRLGPGMAMALISLFYALILGSISIGFMTAARRQVNMFGDDEKPEYVISPVAAGLASFLLVMASFATLLASF